MKKSLILQCKICGKDFKIPRCRELTAKYCSKKCSDKKEHTQNLVNCRECGKEFHRKQSHQNRRIVHGNFCGTECAGAFKSRHCIGENNSNYRGRNYDFDGYRIFSPAASLKLGFGKIKIHHAVVFQVLEIKKLPKGMHVHHKDCNVENNNPENLLLMLNSDHRWLHKQYGSATLAAYESGKINVNDIASWSDDHVKAKFLLLLNVIEQKKIIEKLNINDFNYAELFSISSLTKILKLK